MQQTGLAPGFSGRVHAQAVFRSAGKPVNWPQKLAKRSKWYAALSAEETSPGPPTIQIEFVSREGGVQTVTCESGDILRDVMLYPENKVDLYTTWGKVANCGGGGQCGTCIVSVLEGEELLSERNETENNKLRKKPASFRLACQTNVGDGTNSGRICVQTKPV